MQQITNQEQENQTLPQKLDNALLGSALFCFFVGFYLAGSPVFANQIWIVRIIVVLITLAVSVSCLWKTTYKHKLLSLFKGSRIEIQKVFWPSKNEVVKTTLLVLAIVALFALVFSIVDGLLTLIVKWVL